MNKFVRFLPIADAFAAMSKYPRTKVGALVLGPRFEVRSTGWNGAPRGSRADEDDRLSDRDTALTWTAHAEANREAREWRENFATLQRALVGDTGASGIEVAHALRKDAGELEFLNLAASSLKV